MENCFDVKTISEILTSQDSVNNEDLDKRIFGLPLSLGEYAQNDIEYQYALENLILLSKRKNLLVRANSILGLEYLARTNGKLSKDIALPIIQTEWQINIENRATIETAIEDINHYLNWGLNTSQW